MDLKIMRAHYYSPDNGLHWVPKRSFISTAEIIKAGFDLEYKYKSYVCNTCNNFHISRIKKGVGRD